MANKKKKIKKWIIAAVAVLAVAAVIFVPRFTAERSGKGNAVYTGDIFTVTPRDVEKTVSATGLVESDEDTTAKVYSSLAYEIATVNVSLGDAVAEGDVLCVYDTETLDRAIKEKELSMDTSERSASLSLSNAKLNYDTYRTGMNNGTNAAVVNAQSAYDTALENYENAVEDRDEYLAKSDSQEIRMLNAAKRDLDKAQKDYDDYLAEGESGENIELNAARRRLDDAQKDYDDYKADIENGNIIELNTAQRNVDKAQSDYDDLKYELDNGTNLQLSSAKRSLDTARDNYEDYKEMVDDDETSELMNASAALDAAEDAVDNALDVEAELEDEIDELKDELAAEKAKPEEEQDQSLISSLNTQISKKERELAAQEKTTAKLREQRMAAHDAYDMAYEVADMSLDTYKTAYENAQESYDSVVESLNDQLALYEKALADAKDAYATAEDRVTAQLEVYESAVLDAEDAYNTAKNAADDKLESYDSALKKAQDAYDDAKEAADDQLEGYEDAVTVSKRALNDAEIALKNAKTTAKDQLESYRIAYENAKNSASTSLADFQLASLYEDLAKTTVTSPISGTVTAVYAVEEEVPSGVMFVIEDTNNLVVTSTVKAYDLDKVSVGMKVKIETDASGDDVFYGELISIAPAATKDATGSIISTNDAEFETVVRITDKSDKLRIGVSARIEYIVDAAEGALSVPSSAILTDSEGSFVLTVTDGTDGKIILSRTSVECGTTDGIYTAVTGLDENARVVDNAENYKLLVGKELSLSEVDINASGMSMADMMAMGPMGRG